MNDSKKKKASAIVFTLLVLFGVGMAVMVAVQRIIVDNVMVRDGRDSVGVLRRLMVGEIAHAGQYLPPEDPMDHGKTHKDLRRLPVTYWHPQGPVGQAMAKFDWFPGMDNTWRADARLPASLIAQGLAHGPLPAGQLVAAWSEPPIAAIPLKAGALAAYARPFQTVDFYEPSTTIHELSFPDAGTPKFTFVRDAQLRGARVRVFQGKERDLLATQAPQRFYHALFVDTVRGDLDTLAEDLLTQEGMTALLATVADQGVIGFHVSNRKLEAAPVVIDVAQSLKCAIRFAVDDGDKGKGHYASEWVMIASRPENLRHLTPTGGRSLKWAAPVGGGKHIWTDAGPHDRADLQRR